MSPSRSVEPPLSSGQSVPAPLSISFSGSGFLATYQLGVAQSMRDRSPRVLQTAPKVMGASAGSLVAAAVVCGSSLGKRVNYAEKLTSLERMLRLLLPADAHIRASGRLAIAMTRIPDGQNIMVSKFTSREDVVQVCYAIDNYIDKNTVR
uniref:PNPLA domain-containing protein n=1 Tax=Oncorhynchus mykiss TaxID=8022 RepID=A0A8K9X1U8_ONCMY